MASVSIRRRETKSGPHFQVRFRLGGRAYPVQHGGSFPTLKEARTRRDLIAGSSPRAAIRHVKGGIRARARTLQVPDWLMDRTSARRTSGSAGRRSGHHGGLPAKTLAERLGRDLKYVDALDHRLPGSFESGKRR